MKITSTSVKSPFAGASAATRTDGTKGANIQSGNAGGKSAVDLSSAARQLSSLQSSENDINVARVQAIRDALASGELKIDPSRIADGILASARDLLK